MAMTTAQSKHRFEQPARVCVEASLPHDEWRQTPAEMLRPCVESF
jgi:hypothetical protein